MADLDQVTAAANGDHTAPVGHADEVTTGCALSSRTLAQLLCDAVVRSIRHSGTRTDLGRAQRLASPQQKALLIERDRGCLIPGCPVPAAACDAHHTRYWSEGGATDLQNLGLLCGRHHTEVHLGMWRLEVRDKIPWAIPPRYYDPHQQPRRNTLHEAIKQARDLGIQLRLDDPG